MMSGAAVLLCTLAVALSLHLCYGEPQLEAVDGKLLLMVDAESDVQLVVEGSSEPMSLIELFSRTARLEAIVRELNSTLQARIAGDCSATCLHPKQTRATFNRLQRTLTAKQTNLH
eukprot:m.168825 g.168825  ORF g.168825 m.168825 type:complete len:116 (+) comp16657_c0_seq4:14-361(+)